ncbi:hypothetical protein ABT272_43475 [Streptomyces sp900105245]|uniref:Uncharacterized protein n=1 Tax=Streptomyces sp. 900105245 TaxID=3154379 RepID=A0ABV1UMI9_9ACTN
MEGLTRGNSEEDTLSISTPVWISKFLNSLGVARISSALSGASSLVLSTEVLIMGHEWVEFKVASIADRASLPPGVADSEVMDIYTAIEFRAYIWLLLAIGMLLVSLMGRWRGAWTTASVTFLSFSVAGMVYVEVADDVQLFTKVMGVASLTFAFFGLISHWIPCLLLKRHPPERGV